MIQALLIFAAVLQAVAVTYGLVLLYRRNGAEGAWLFLLGAMLSMLAWRTVVALEIDAPAYFNPAIAIWGSSCTLGAMFLFGREVGRRARVEAERDNLLTSERTARSEAERANRLKDEFLATLSHELRTPLAVILGWCTILEKSKGNEADLERGLQTIERNARIQTRLVDDMLDVTRIRAGTLHLELVPLPLEQPVRAAMEDIRPQAEARGLTVQLHCEQSATVSGDSARLQQLVSNLLVNAVKFTPKGGAIALTIRAVQGQAELEVSDTGEGISADFIPHLFERFRQQDSSNRRKHGGLGLGLSIGADLVRLHGGSISAYSAGPGRGARFTVRMPLTTAATAPQAPVYVEPQPLELTMRKHLVGMNIVVIDDEEDVRATVARLLVQIGADVVVLDAGTTIEEVLRRKRPDLLLIDIGMPDEDGYTLIRRIRKLSADSGGDTPAISLTAFAREEDRVRALAAGFQEHLTKPVDLPRLTNAILSTVRFSRSKAVLE